MSKAKFTKGDWVVKGSSMSMGSSYRGSFSIESSGFSGDITDANEANKALIAAAPEMYAEIESEIELLKEVRGDSHSEYIITLLDERIAHKQSLLAKARGE